jgi:predicted transcriptional regulator of viral defense system
MDKKTNYQALYDIAENQAGYFTSEQADKAGYSWERLSRLSKNGKFKRIERGVYRIALFPSSPFEDLFIAILKSSPHAVISHESALTVFDLSDAMPGEIHITIPRTSSRRREGIRHHTKGISKDEITIYQGLRVTTVPRTIIDLIESGFDPIQIKNAIEQAIHRGLIPRNDLLQQAKKKSLGIFNKVNTYMPEINA